jgi:hypothetical protein
MAQRTTAGRPSHRAYWVIRRKGHEDYWLNIGLVFARQDGTGFNVELDPLTMDSTIVCCEIGEEEEVEAAVSMPAT